MQIGGHTTLMPRNKRRFASTLMIGFDKWIATAGHSDGHRCIQMLGYEIMPMPYCFLMTLPQVVKCLPTALEGLLIYSHQCAGSVEAHGRAGAIGSVPENLVASVILSINLDRGDFGLINRQYFNNCIGITCGKYTTISYGCSIALPVIMVDVFRHKTRHQLVSSYRLIYK